MSAVIETQQPESNGALAVSSSELIRNPSMMAQFNALAEVMAAGKVTVPVHLQKSQGDCFAIVMQAAQWGMNPFSVAQKTHLVNGTLGYEAQLVNAVIQSSGAITGRFHYEYRGEGNALECRVGAIIKGETEIVWGEWLSSSSVTTKNSPLWKTNPKQQMGYLQVKNWARLYCPGAILGVYSDDELQELPERSVNSVGEKEINPVSQGKPELPFCSDDEFLKITSDSLDPVTGEITKMRWKSGVQSGKTTAQQAIETISTRNHLTDAQIATIKSWEPINA
jgi:hypothetical protein